ncbi:MAG TPA: PEGA domain-containing protein, partial [Burkholderiales bacterium]|nr:PEGA domain-containing protein [Burkholderiales bacterium]
GALYYSPEWSELTAFVSRMQEAPAKAALPLPAEPAPAAPVAVVAKETAPPPVPAAVPAPAPTPVALPMPPKPPVAQPAEPASAPRPAGTAKLLVAVSPRGELYVDGKHFGATPPLTTLDLEPGLHRIEIRSGSRRPYLTYMTVEAGDERRIRHDFNARPSAPPR